MNDKIKRGQFVSLEWPTISLAWGLSGIICFYAMMEIHFPHEGWDKVIHDYLIVSKENIEKELSSDLSLFSGLAGLSLAVNLSSQNGSRYQTLLAALNDLLVREVQTVYLSRTEYYLNPEKPIPPSFYNLANGLSGIMIYFMSCDNDSLYRSLAQDCLHCLVKILSFDKEINGSKVPPWYISSEHETIMEYKEKHPEGSFKLDLPNGLPGILAALSLAKIKGFDSLGLTDLITKMADWIKSKQITHEQQANWNHLVSMNEELRQTPKTIKIQHLAWFYGAPGILRCLYLASQALQDVNLATFAEQEFLSLIQSDKKNEIKDTSFSFGKAGLLATIYEMACDTKNPTLFKETQLLEEEIKKHHHPNHEFGFQTLLYDEKSSLQWCHNPSLLNGAAGIGLTLLQVQGKQNMQWNRPFVIA